MGKRTRLKSSITCNSRALAEPHELLVATATEVAVAAAAAIERQGEAGGPIACVVVVVSQG